MNHIKLYENFNLKDERHKNLNLSQWVSLLSNIISFDKRYLSLLPVEMKKEIRKTIFMAQDIFSPSSENHNLPINYLVVYINGSDPIFIYETKDEYFGLAYDYPDLDLVSGRKKTFRVKCDQIDSVIEVISYLELVTQISNKL